MNKLIPLLLVISLAWIFHSCEHEPVLPEPLPGTTDTTQPKLDTLWPEPVTNTCDTNLVYFENTILKLFVTRCGASGYPTPTGATFNCHGSEPYAEGLNFTTYEGILEGVDGEISDPDKSDILEAIDESDPDKKMPKRGLGGNLSAAERQLIYDWIKQGAQNNRCNTCDDTEPATVSWSQDVAPLLYQNCRGCHNDQNKEDVVLLKFVNSNPTSPADIRYADVKANLASIQARMINNNEDVIMPRHIGKLYECEFDMIKRWIDDGAPEN